MVGRTGRYHWRIDRWLFIAPHRRKTLSIPCAVSDLAGIGFAGRSGTDTGLAPPSRESKKINAESSMDRKPSYWAGRDLWRIFRRGIERDRALCIGLDDGRYVDAAQCLETGRLLQRQFRGGDILFVFGESDLAGRTRDGSRRVDRWEFGWTAGGPCSARDFALDRGDHWRCCCNYLSGARITIL